MPDLTIFWFAAIILVVYLLFERHYRRLEIWGKIGLTIGIIMSAIGLLTFVFGARFELPISIRLAIALVGIVIVAVVILNHYGHLRQPRREERERTIEIVELNRSTINRISLTSFGSNPQRFVGNVWTIRVHNELPKSVSDCSVDLRIFTDGRDRGYALPLRWRGHDELPTTCNNGGTLDTREQYRDSLPLSYIGDLYISGTDSVTIPVDGRNEILFSFTFSESDSIFIVSLTSNYMLGEREMPSVTITIADLNRAKFLIRFYNGQGTYEKTFRLDTNSWNEINLVEV